MAYIVLNRTNQIQTQTPLTEEEVGYINQMVENGKTIEEIEHHLLTQDHVITSNKVNRTNLSVINFSLEDQEAVEILQALEHLFG